jgi:hypothetical protein
VVKSSRCSVGVMRNRCLEYACSEAQTLLHASVCAGQLALSPEVGECAIRPPIIQQIGNFRGAPLRWKGFQVFYNIRV